MNTSFVITTLMSAAVVSASQDFYSYPEPWAANSNAMPADSDDQHWQQWPDWCYITNGRKQVISVTCGPKYSQTEECDWSPGGGYRIWMRPGQQSYITFDVQYSEKRRAEAYFKQNLLGGSIQFEFDTKFDNTCSCVGQVSLLAMPAINPDGSLNHSDTHFGCDARGLTSEGALCPEFTLFEGNTFGFRTTPRACQPPTETGYFSECDADGDLVVDVKD